MAYKLVIFSNAQEDIEYAAFWYEFARESPTTKALVEEFKAEETASFKGKPTARYREIQRMPLYWVIFTLAHLIQFPATPWKNLEDREAVQLDLDRRTLGRHSVVELFSQPGDLEYLLSNPPPHTTTHVIQIDWRGPDTQLCQAFEHILCQRPEKYSQFKNGSLQQVGVDQYFPFRKAKALLWLGVLRCFKAAGSNWATYLDIYPSNPDPRARKRERKQAQLIVEWFNAGTPLKKRDFR